MRPDSQTMPHAPLAKVPCPADPARHARAKRPRTTACSHARAARHDTTERASFQGRPDSAYSRHTTTRCRSKESHWCEQSLWSSVARMRNKKFVEQSGIERAAMYMAFVGGSLYGVGPP